MTYSKSIKTIIGIFIAIFTLFSSINSRASSEETEKFNPGAYIIDHVVDSYGWHITTINKHHITIPLPVILIEEGKPVVFMSSKFHHGTAAYQGYAMGFTPETSGKIVKLNNNYTGELMAGTEYPIDHICKFDISITKNVCSLFLSLILICWIFLSIAQSYKKRPLSAPKGLQSLLEPIIIFIRDEVVVPSIGEKKRDKYLPYILTLFFFIFLNNMMGLIPIFPGGANLTGNIAVTGTLALLTFLITSFSGNKHYWKDIFNTPGVPWWLKFPLPIMPIVEFIGIFTKPFVLMIRLFANISAGHIIILVFIGLIFIFGEMSPVIGYAVSPFSIFFYVFMGLLELIVAFVQAFVFALLSALYIGMATAEHEQHEEEHIYIAEN